MTLRLSDKFFQAHFRFFEIRSDVRKTRVSQPFLKNATIQCRRWSTGRDQAMALGEQVGRDHKIGVRIESCKII